MKGCRRDKLWPLPAGRVIFGRVLALYALLRGVLPVTRLLRRVDLGRYLERVPDLVYPPLEAERNEISPEGLAIGNVGECSRTAWSGKRGMFWVGPRRPGVPGEDRCGHELETLARLEGLEFPTRCLEGSWTAFIIAER
jgi:hypothetical protein